MEFPGSPSHVIPRPAESRPAHRSAPNRHGETTDILIGIPEDPRPTVGQPFGVHPGEVAGIKNSCVSSAPGQDLGGRKVRSVAGDSLPDRKIDTQVKISLPG